MPDEVDAGADRGQPLTKGAQTREAILAAAIARFGRDGYRITSVANIARDASVSGTAVYAYFPSKEALFLAAVDEDAAAVIREGLARVMDPYDAQDWQTTLLFTLIEAIDHHPLARRLLAGLEPDVTDRVLQIPALEELRKVLAERLRSDQVTGKVRPDIDPVVTASGLISIVLSLLMSVVQIGGGAADTYGSDVIAVIDAALRPAEPPPPAAG